MATASLQNPGTGELMTSCTIIVTDSNALTRLIHDRMPVVLDKADIQPSRRVNKTGSGDDDPTLIGEVAA